MELKNVEEDIKANSQVRPASMLNSRYRDVVCVHVYGHIAD